MALMSCHMLSFWFAPTGISAIIFSLHMTEMISSLDGICASSAATQTARWRSDAAASAPCTSLNPRMLSATVCLSNFCEGWLHLIHISVGDTLRAFLAVSPPLLPADVSGMALHCSTSSSTAKTPGTLPASSEGAPSFVCP